MAKTASISFSLSHSLQKLPFFAILMYALYGHPGYFKFKGKHRQYGPCFQTIFPFLMTIIKERFAAVYWMPKVCWNLGPLACRLCISVILSGQFHFFASEIIFIRFLKHYIKRKSRSRNMNYNEGGALFRTKIEITLYLSLIQVASLSFL